MTENTPSRRKVNALRVVRWLLVVPFAFAGWYVGLIVALVIHTAHKALCPAQYLVSGMCAAPWSEFVQGSAIIIGAILVGALVVLLPALIAPNHRKRMAWIAYLFGLLYSVYFLVSIPGIWQAVVAAAVAGAWVLWLFHHAGSVDSKGTT